jgi:hypothetical protein
MLVGLISCSKAKTPNAAPARHLYSPSSLFSGALRNLEGRADVIYVLSAKYGLLPLDQVVEPYDQALKDATAAGREVWAKEVLQALRDRHGNCLDGITFEFHAGMAYRNPLERMLQAAGASCSCPVDGLGMGERLAYYKQGRTQDRPMATRTAAATRMVAPAPVTTDLRTLVNPLRGATLQTDTGAQENPAQSRGGNWWRGMNCCGRPGS